MAASPRELKEARGPSCIFFFLPVCLNAAGVSGQLDEHPRSKRPRSHESHFALWVFERLDRTDVKEQDEQHQVSARLGCRVFQAEAERRREEEERLSCHDPQLSYYHVSSHPPSMLTRCDFRLSYFLAILLIYLAVYVSLNPNAQLFGFSNDRKKEKENLILHLLPEALAVYRLANIS